MVLVVSSVSNVTLMTFHREVSHSLALNQIKVVWDPLGLSINPNHPAWVLIAHSSAMILDHLVTFQHSQGITPTVELQVDPIMELLVTHTTHIKVNTPTDVVVGRLP